MSPNNIQINNVSNINISKNKKNAYGVDYSKYIYAPFIIVSLVIGVLFGLRYFIVSKNIP